MSRTISSFTEDGFKQLIEQEGIRDMSKVLNPSLLQATAKLLLNWKPLARYLNLDDPEVEQIEHDHHGDYDEQKYQCLYRWSQINGRQATLERLLRVIYFSLKNVMLIQEIAQAQKTVTATDWGKENIREQENTESSTLVKRQPQKGEQSPQSKGGQTNSSSSFKLFCN